MSTLDNKLQSNITSQQSQPRRAPASNSIYRGHSSVNPSNTGFKLYDVAIIKQDIINHFHIRQGEKLENPEFGTIIWDVLFEPLTDNLKAAIIKNVERVINADPRVSAEDIIVDVYETGLQIECTLTYLNYSIAEKMKMQFDQENGLIA